MTSTENKRRAYLRRYDGKCKNGHPFEGDNVYVHPKTGKRMCRECRRAAWQKMYHADPEKYVAKSLDRRARRMG